MKKRIISAALFVIMLAAIGGVGMLVFKNFGTFASIADGTFTVKGVQWLYMTAALLAVWLILFTALVRVNRKSGMYSYSRTDQLTGLGNKKQVRDHFESINASYHKYSCLAYVGCNWKSLQSQCSKSQCDKLQIGAAEIFSEACGDYDCAARVGDGAFVFSLYCKDGLHAQQRMDALVEQLNQYQYQAFGRDVTSFHAGIALPEKDRTTFETVLANAKIGYRYALDNRLNTFVCTRDILIREASRDRRRETLLRAIEAQQFEPFMQFVYDTKAKKFIGAEVLSRWNNPEEGFQMPAYYINDMRTTGVIGKFDLYMLERICAILQSWAGTEFGDLTLSCNITRVTVSSEEFLQDFHRIIKKYQFDRKNLILEITEDALIGNQTVAYRNVVGCKQEGVQIAIDDFGVGNSSISDLGNYPVDVIKIDRQIILKSETERGDALLHGLIHLAHHLNIQVLCEGVETENQRDIAMNNDCDFIQGYFYSYVFPVEEAKQHYLDSCKEPQNA